MEHGLDTGVIAVVAASALLWSLLSARLERFDISAPMAFVVLGLVFTHGPLALIDVHLQSSTARSLAEVTLALVLFVDASRINVRKLRADAGLPVRLLGIGLPLTIGLGCVVAAGLYRDTGLWVAAVIAAAVAPTDAALGAPIVQDTRVPARIRRVLNVESGLNDGIATPFVGIFLAGAAASESVHGANGVASAVVDLLGGAGMGIAIGVGGALLLRAAVARGLSAPAFRALAPLALALLAYAGTVQVGANGFVAAFVAGMAFGSLLPSELEPTIAFTDVAGEVLSLLMWFVVGAAMLVPAFQHAQWQDVVFAVLALTVIRMVPVAIACFGSAARSPHRGVHRLVRPARAGLGHLRAARGGHPRRARRQQGAHRRHRHRRAERACSRRHRVTACRPLRSRGLHPSLRTTRAAAHTRAAPQVPGRQWTPRSMVDTTRAMTARGRGDG